MIVTNFIANIVVRIAAIFTPGTVGVTIWPFIFISPPSQATKRLIKHEERHLQQWRRYWIIGFLPLYLWQFFTIGYKNMPLELEARKAELE